VSAHSLCWKAHVPLPSAVALHPLGQKQRVPITIQLVTQPWAPRWNQLLPPHQTMSNFHSSHDSAEWKLRLTKGWMSCSWFSDPREASPQEPAGRAVGAAAAREGWPGHPAAPEPCGSTLPCLSAATRHGKRWTRRRWAPVPAASGVRGRVAGRREAQLHPRKHLGVLRFSALSSVALWKGKCLYK